MIRAFMAQEGPAVHHLALRVTDPERSIAFYNGVLGLPEVRRSHEQGRLRSVWLRCGPAVLMLERAVRGGGPADGSGHVLVLEVEDLAPWLETLARAGVTVDDRTSSTLYFQDPDGHRVGLTVYPRRDMLAARSAASQ